MTYPTDRNPWFINPHLNGQSFFLTNGEIGVLLLHGFTATTVEVQPLAHILHQRGFTVAAPLLPGHGTTPQDANRTRWLDWLNSAVETYQTLAQTCQVTFIGGESMGALLALLIAHRYPQVCGLLLFAPAYHIPGLEKARLLSLFLPTFPKTYAKAQPEELYPWQGYGVVPLKAALQLLQLQAEVQKCLPQITQPTLIFQGRLDRTVDPQGAVMLYENLGAKDKELIWLEHSSHCILLDRELDTVVSYILAFLEKHSKRFHPPLGKFTTDHWGYNIVE